VRWCDGHRDEFALRRLAFAAIESANGGAEDFVESIPNRCRNRASCSSAKATNPTYSPSNSSWAANGSRCTPTSTQRPDRPRIFDIASAVGFGNVPLLGAYGGTKAAVLCFTDRLAFEPRPSGVRVSDSGPFGLLAGGLSTLWLPQAAPLTGERFACTATNSRNVLDASQRVLALADRSRHRCGRWRDPHTLPRCSAGDVQQNREKACPTTLTPP
jgi:NAD(P)-dependent dehydrogenase (short-subunit alcohol dehydrogenase family)